MKLKFRYILIFLFLTNIYSYRDPFSFPNSNNKIKPEALNIQQPIKVLALLNSKNKKGAILKNSDQTEVVFVGDELWNYKIKNIDKQSVTLLNSDQKILKLFYEDKD